MGLKIEVIKPYLEQEDLTWEQRKKVEQELAKKKRRYTMVDKDGEEDWDKEELQNVGRRRAKKMRYTLLEEDWGETDNCKGAVEDVMTVKSIVIDNIV